MEVAIVESLAEVPAPQWDRLAGDDPFLSHAFLSALEESGCATGATGWAPRHLLLRSGGELAGAMPLYLKTHSYGEYVFDWAWADAYFRHGAAYYPKLVCAVPFTPVSGRRLLAASAAGRARLLRAALELARGLGVSSLHCLFPTASETAELREHGLLVRRGVQFHWENRGYGSFEDFLGRMSHDKRKKIRQERRRVREAGIVFERLEGEAATEADWAFFHRCYRNTYRDHGSTPYLNLDFFLRLGRTLPHAVLLVLARRGGAAIASALFLRNERRLFGRYWGAIEFHPCLHFETCYYQAIEYCIERGLAAFEGGARGEHKLARGMTPVPTASAHWIAHPAFRAAIERFLERETAGVEDYVDELNERAPFRREPEPAREEPPPRRRPAR
jgi:predicted N-acyltransferase